VLGDNTINLRVEPEVSSIDPAASIQINDLVIPGLQTRRASTTLELRDGESFAIAGLLQRDFQTTINQVPLLGNIPIIGALFRSTQFKKGETELLIIVTARLVQPIRPDQVVLPTDRVRDPNVESAVGLGEPYDPVPLPAAQPAEGGDYEF
jgi:pilus assembly protein CpaC